MSRSRFAVGALLCAVTIAYASTIIGVGGPNYVPLGWDEALRLLTRMPYVQNGSDQRSDWMGNLLMLIPLGFLAAGSLSRKNRGSPVSAVTAFVLCALFILAVKYAQLFFPPRTVTLNYVVAQCLGAGAGIVLFGVLRRPLLNFGQGASRLENLRLVLRIYTGLLILFMLLPLDFALDANDLMMLRARLPGSFTAISGEGRPLAVRCAVIVAGILAVAPIGAMLTIGGRGQPRVYRSIAAATATGVCAMAVVYALTCLLISGSPSLPAVVFRGFGIAVGAWAIHRLTRADPARLRRDLGRLVPWCVPAWLLALAATNGLLSMEWTTPEEAAKGLYRLGALPLFNYYIVTKPQAAKNIIAHAVMYAPVGAMIWARARRGGGKVLAFCLAACLSAIVEAGRFLRPGLVPDINAIPLAGLAAWATHSLMPMAWRMVAALTASGPAAVARDGTVVSTGETVTSTGT